MYIRPEPNLTEPPPELDVHDEGGVLRVRIPWRRGSPGLLSWVPWLVIGPLWSYGMANFASENPVSLLFKLMALFGAGYTLVRVWRGLADALNVTTLVARPDGLDVTYGPIPIWGYARVTGLRPKQLWVSQQILANFTGGDRTDRFGTTPPTGTR